MTIFRISGRRDGRKVTITWKDGDLIGDPATVWWIKRLAEMAEGRPVRMLVGPVTTHDHLDSPWSARALIQSVLAGKTTFEGEMPALDVPPGAVP